MKSFYIFLLFVLIGNHAANAQGIAINNTGNLPDTSAMLDVSSAAKGFLPPRITMAQRNLINLPANGLIVYQTDDVTGLYCNSGTASVPNWKLIGPAAPVAYGYFSQSSTQLSSNSLPQSLFFDTNAANGIILIGNNNALLPNTGIYKIAYH